MVFIYKYQRPAFLFFLVLYASVQFAYGQAITASKMNPAIAAVGEFEASTSDDAALAHPHELLFRGGDIDIYSYVDPYFKAEVVIAFSDRQADFEEAYLESLTLPAGLKLRVGKFKVPFGKWNTVHGHALPVINMPLSWERAFGEDGLNESGVAVSEMMPFLPTYHEIIGLVLNGNNDIAFNGAATRDLLYMGHLKNFFELGGYRTLEVGISYARGRNNGDGSPELMTNLAGANVIVQWKHSLLPLERALTLWAEIYHSRRDTLDLNAAVKTYVSTGYFLLGKLLFSRRWYATCLYDCSGDPLNTGERFNSISAGLAFQPSEFSEFKFEYRRVMSNRNDRAAVNELKGMLIFTIGAHGPHAF
ncbi:MAG: hypothetical protein JW768_10050 [Chitinispirillaceae bacterium]|nr:hypothetical protein [Chitinispirillaceae bacterium]